MPKPKLTPQDELPAVDPVEIPESAPVELPTVEPVAVRRLRVHRAFRGALTNEQAILPDMVYYADDPALFGLAEYLVTHAYAEWIA